MSQTEKMVSVSMSMMLKMMLTMRSRMRARVRVRVRIGARIHCTEEWTRRLFPPIPYSMDTVPSHLPQSMLLTVPSSRLIVFVRMT